MDRPGLFCRRGSIDLVESLQHPTHFCKLTGKSCSKLCTLYTVQQHLNVSDKFSNFLSGVLKCPPLILIVNITLQHV